MKYEFTAKKFAILLLALVLLLIPTYIAIGYYYNESKPDSVRTENTYLLISDPKGNSFEIHQDEDTTRWSMFESMIKNGQSCAAIPDSVNKTENMVLAKYVTESKTVDDEGTQTESDRQEEQYAFYFTTDKSSCYYMDPTKKIFKIADADATSFLADEKLSSYLYKAAETPSCTILGTSVLPSTLEWYYLAAGNNYQKIENTNSEQKTFECEASQYFTVDFSAEPSKCLVSVSEPNGTKLYDGAYANLPTVSIKENTTLRFDITAEWLKEDNDDSYGKETFVFFANMTAPAAFTINTTKIYQGEFAVITAKNIKDSSKIQFTSTPALPYTPVFYKTGDYVSAFIPVSYGCAQGDYTFAVSYGTITDSFTLKVVDYEYGYKDSSITIPTSLISESYTQQNIDIYKKLVEDICSATSFESQFSGTFIDYASKTSGFSNGKSTLKLGFARNVKINGDTSLLFEHTGLDYIVTVDSTAIPAVNSGKVVYTGNNAILGNFVVVDHGCGLRSWYAHLGTISAAVGQEVKKGDALGYVSKTNTTGVTVTGYIHIGYTIGNQPIAPYSLHKNGITYGIFADDTQ